MSLRIIWFGTHELIIRMVSYVLIFVIWLIFIIRNITHIFITHDLFCVLKKRRRKKYDSVGIALWCIVVPPSLTQSASTRSSMTDLIFKLYWASKGICHFFWATFIKGDLRTICRFSYMKVYKLITLGTKFKTLLSLGRKITMFSKFITNYIEQGWWHSSLTLKCMHLLLKEVNKRGRHAYNLHGWTCLPSGIVMEIHCHITGIFEAAVRLRLPSCCSV